MSIEKYLMLADHIRSILQIQTIPTDIVSMVMKIGGTVSFLDKEQAYEKKYDVGYRPVLQIIPGVYPEGRFEIFTANWIDYKPARLHIATQFAKVVMFHLEKDKLIDPDRRLISEETTAANHLGAALLMPQDEFSQACQEALDVQAGTIEPDIIAEKFQVPVSAVKTMGIYRLFW